MWSSNLAFRYISEGNEIIFYISIKMYDASNFSTSSPTTYLSFKIYLLLDGNSPEKIPTLLLLFYYRAVLGCLYLTIPIYKKVD